MEVKIMTVPTKMVACVRHVGPYKECEGAWEKLFNWAGPKGFLGEDMEYIGLCHDDPEVTPADKIRYDACLTVPVGTDGEGDVTIQEIGGRDYAMTVHIGSYDNLPAVYAFVYGEWLPQSERKMAFAPCMEIYRNTPENTPQDKLITEIYVPLEDT